MKKTDNKFSLLIGVLIVAIVIVVTAIFLQDEIVAELDRKNGVNLSEYDIEEIDLKQFGKSVEEPIVVANETEDTNAQSSDDGSAEPDSDKADEQTVNVSEEPNAAPDAATDQDAVTGMLYENVKVQIVEQLIFPENSETGNGRFLIMVLNDPNEFLVTGAMYEMSSSPELFEQLALGTKHYLDIKNNEVEGSTQLKLQVDKIVK